jgi:hypothetical protein
MATKDLYSANNFQRMSFGDFGFRLLDHPGTASTPSGEYFCMVECISTNATISLTNDCASGDTSLTDYSLKEGQIIYGNFTNISISTGHVICYLRKPS